MTFIETGNVIQLTETALFDSSGRSMVNVNPFGKGHRYEDNLKLFRVFSPEFYSSRD